MSLSAEVEAHLRAESQNPPTSPLKLPIIDTVDWASSQPVVIQSLLRDATKRRGKQPPRSGATSVLHRDHQRASSSCPNASIGRLVRRDSSSVRARLGLNPPNRISNPPPAPDDSIWKNDRHVVLATCQDVSERMDENVFSPSGNDVISTNQRAKTHYSKGPSKQRYTSMPLPDHVHVQGTQQLAPFGTSKLRAGFSLPAISPSSSSSPSTIKSSYSFSSDTSVATEPNSCDVSMSEIEDKPNPPPVGRSSALASTSSSFSRSISAPGGSNAPVEKLHPLLLQNHRRPRSLADPPVIPINKPVPHPEHVAPPAPLHSTIPPALGMRRTRTVSPMALHPLPSRRKAFKPPLLSQSASQPAPSAPLTQKPNNTFFSTTPLSRHESHPSVAPETPEPQGEPSNQAHPHQHSSRSPAEPDDEPPYSACASMDESLDADSSFGELSSFDMDALEATMQQYD